MQTVRTIRTVCYLCWLWGMPSYFTRNPAVSTENKQENHKAEAPLRVLETSPFSENDVQPRVSTVSLSIDGLFKQTQKA